METIIELENGVLSDNHLVMTDKGWVEAKKLIVGDNIKDFTGKIVKIEKITKCEKRPDAPIVGEINN